MVGKKSTCCNDMNGSRGDCAEWNKSEKDKYRMISPICEISKTKWANKTDIPS